MRGVMSWNKALSGDAGALTLGPLPAASWDTGRGAAALENIVS